MCHGGSAIRREEFRHVLEHVKHDLSALQSRNHAGEYQPVRRIVNFNIAIRFPQRPGRNDQ